MKLTRHNGRSGKNGTYNPRHNGRRFNVENSEHIDVERSGKNVYWDCYRGFTPVENRDKKGAVDFTFEQIERAYYVEHYSDHVDAQNERNEKSRHTERNRTVEDILKNNKTCPEESIYQIGTIEESAPSEILFQIVNEFCGEFERRFGSHVHILDWALHLDEGTPHIHKRHVFDCENRYGELCPQQEKALEKLSIPLPNPDKPKGRNNNRKQTFDAVCRTMPFDITRKYGLHLDMDPEYGGREYLEKQDYILMKQKEKIAENEQAIGQLTMKLDDVEQLIDEVTETAYEKAVEIVTDSVRAETQKADIDEIEAYKKWVTSPERRTPQDKKDFVGRCLSVLQDSLISKAQKIVGNIRSVLLNPKVRQENTDMIKEQARQSIKERLAEAKLEADRMENRFMADTSEMQKEREYLEKRNQEIDDMFLSLYTDKAKGILTEQRFMKLTAAIEQEQESNRRRLQELALMMRQSDEQESDVKAFIREIRQYATIEELDETVLNRLISRIRVGEVKKIDGQRYQEVKIIYNFVGEIPDITE